MALMSAMSAKPAAALDVNGFCRTWRDSNGHLFILERIEPDPERGGEALLLHGTSSNCQCATKRLQNYSHDGPYTCYAESAHALATGDVFGWNPEPSTLEDVQRFVTFLMGLTPEEWSHIRYVVEDDGTGEEYRDYDEWVPSDVVGALFALARVPRQGLSEYGGSEDPPIRQAATIAAMMTAGHTDTEIIALALILDLDPDGAASLPATPTEEERAVLMAQMTTLIALRATTNVAETR